MECDLEDIVETIGKGLKTKRLWVEILRNRNQTVTINSKPRQRSQKRKRNDKEPLQNKRRKVDGKEKEDDDSLIEILDTKQDSDLGSNLSFEPCDTMDGNDNDSNFVPTSPKE